MSNPPPFEDIAAQANEALKEIEEAADLSALEAIRVRVLGKKGWIKEFEQQMKAVTGEERAKLGRQVNDAKKSLTEAIATRKEGLSESKPQVVASFDVTLPGIRPLSGHRHPIVSTMEEIKSILTGLGFRYDDYPEVETEHYNFDALNTPSWHPARDMHDSFYTRSGHVLRTHTSAFQTHAMQEFGPPPIRAMTSGRCYRRDQIDASHFPIFHQLDAIAVDRDISFADLKWTLYELARGLFGSDVRLRFRPSYFPFTTPSAEVDVWFDSKWMEILGAGMIRPEVLQAGGISPSQWQGFAFGLGVDRMAMSRHGVSDIRQLYENEDAFLRQF